MKMRFALAVVLTLLSACVSEIALASNVTTINNQTWTDLGVGPMDVQTLGGPTYIQVAASAPSGGVGGNVINNGERPYSVNTTLHVYALSGTVNGSTVVSYGTGSSAGGASQSVTFASSTGTDYSANTPTLPNVGAGFSASGPYANYVLVKTIPAGARNNVEIKNSSGANIVVLRDDGTAATGAAPANASLIPLSPGVAAGQQGGAWSSVTFKGRLQIYAPASAAQVTAFVD